MKNVIQCSTIYDLVKVCAGLVPHGVTFEACTFRLTVTLTGGY